MSIFTLQDKLCFSFLISFCHPTFNIFPYEPLACNWELPPPFYFCLLQHKLSFVPFTAIQLITFSFSIFLVSFFLTISFLSNAFLFFFLFPHSGRHLVILTSLFSQLISGLCAVNQGISNITSILPNSHISSLILSTCSL